MPDNHCKRLYFHEITMCVCDVRLRVIVFRASSGRCRQVIMQSLARSSVGANLFTTQKLCRSPSQQKPAAPTLRLVQDYSRSSSELQWTGQRDRRLSTVRSLHLTPQLYSVHLFPPPDTHQAAAVSTCSPLCAYVWQVATQTPPR